ncbi:MAG: fused DSP-PTPase phosphatase/NAD kinase-like protein [Vicinamibacteria bacterium]
MLRTILMLALVAAQESDPLAKHPGISNYYRVRPDVATAGQPSDAAFSDIQKAGFKAVLNLRTEEEGSVEERSKVEALGLDYYNIPIGSDGISKEQVALFEKILGESKNRPILIHCASSNRVGAMWFIHEVLGEGKDEASALEEAKKAGLKSNLEGTVKEYVEKNKHKE